MSTLHGTDISFEPYDMRRVVASAYYAAEVDVDKIMLLGGWKTSRTLFDHYIENVELNEELFDFYKQMRRSQDSKRPLLTSEVEGQRAKRPRLVLDL